MAKKKTSKLGGRLRIGDDWNAITIIALSQQSPLKAVAEFVENSIDAHARSIIITRGKERGHSYLRIMDDGDGIPRDAEGLPDYQFVATHICDSLKRRLSRENREGIQGEFGIGLLSFWTLGKELSLISAGTDGRTYEMRMRKGHPQYTVTERRRLFSAHGTEITVKPLLPGIRHFSGEKIQWYLASELRDRIKRSGVRIQVIDRQARTQGYVEPREFTGQLIHHLPTADIAYGEIYLEIYLNDPSPDHRVSLYRRGTRVLEDITVLDAFDEEPWTSGYLQGVLDVPFLNLTPGTRTGILQDERFSALCKALEPAGERLSEAIEGQKRAAEEQASREMLRSIHRAFKEALLTLPAEEYDWFKVSEARDGDDRLRKPGDVAGGSEQDGLLLDATEEGESPGGQKAFFEFPGPLHSVLVSPASCTVPVGQSKNLRSVPRDRQRRQVEEDLRFEWEVAEGSGQLEPVDAEIVKFTAPEEPGLTRVRVRVRQNEICCEGEGIITVTDALVPELPKSPRGKRGLPAYTFERAPGQLWRSRYEEDRNLIVINNAHRDFVYASKTRALKLRYVCRLYIKELVNRNFPGMSPDKLLERMVELSLYTEENLR